MSGEGPVVRFDSAGAQVRLSGRWTTDAAAQLDAAWSRLAWPRERPVRVHAESIDAMDTAGAWLVERVLAELRARGCEPQLEGLGARHAQLLELVRRHRLASPPPPRSLGPVAGLGARWLRGADEAVDFLAFTGRTAIATLRACIHPARLRPRSIVAQLDAVGLRAIGIVGVLTFLIGVVMAYQGGTQLSQVGANVFIVELVTLATVRELGPMITAIVVAGRSGSAYAAELSAMKVAEELDALRVMGSDPVAVLVVPRVLALVIALPLLTVFADVLSVAGGMLVAATLLDFPAGDFVRRVPEAVSLLSFVLGVAKAPVFAGIIALVGCFHGFQAAGSSMAVGQRTTFSVVHGIFLVIVADAAFSVVFSWLGI